MRTWNVGLGLLCLMLTLGCGSEREQALALLERVNAIDISAAPAQRMPQLSALESLRLGDESLSHLQQLCAGAHRALIDAEVEQAKARHSLDQAGNAPPGQDRLADVKEIAAAIERSTARLQQAQTSFPECERQARDLALRFPKSAP